MCRFSFCEEPKEKFFQRGKISYECNMSLGLISGCRTCSAVSNVFHDFEVCELQLQVQLQLNCFVVNA